MHERIAEVMCEPSAGRAPLKTVAVASGKGGVGKTNVSVNLAVAAALEGRRVMVLDADLGLANVDILLGLKPERTLLDVLQGECGLDDVIMAGPAGISIVPAGSGLTELTRLDERQRTELIGVFDALNRDLDLLVVDTQAGVGDNVASFSRATQEVLVVVCDEPTAMADAYALTKVLNREHGIKRFQVVANMVHDAEHGRRLFQAFAEVVYRFLDVELGLVGVLPHDEYLRKAVRMQVPVVQKFPMSKSALSFRKLARQVLELEPAAQASGHIQFFVERLVSK